MLTPQDFLQKALLEAEFLDETKLTKAKAYSAQEDVSFEESILALGFVTTEQLAVVKADICEVPYLNISQYEISFTNTSLIPRSVAEKYILYPLFHLDNVLTVGMADPLNLNALDQVRQHARCEVETVLCEPDQLRSLIQRAYRLTAGEQSVSVEEASGTVNEDEESQPVVAAVNQLIADAIEQGASDVHLSPDEHDLYIRFRIDGALQMRQGPAKAMHSAIVQRLKVMARLDLTQSRRPQDGKLRYKYNGINYDIRLSTLPTINGENVVMRILRPHAAISDFTDLGLSQAQVDEIEGWIRQPYGMVLVTGPTGSGKTTTLYTALHKLNDPTRNVMTVEDPVEIRLPLVRQIQVNPEISLTFAAALRSILRQDPDVVLVGEIRDSETATIATQASLTGHLVLSTLHTNDASAAVTRLQDLDIPPYLINASLIGVAAQRLVRKACEHCREPYEPDAVMRKYFGLNDSAGGFIKGRGCARCLQTGYKGRIGIYELLSMTAHIKEIIESQSGSQPIRRAALESGMRPMWADGLDKAALGLTTLQEVAKSASVDEQFKELFVQDSSMQLKRIA